MHRRDRGAAVLLMTQRLAIEGGPKAIPEGPPTWPRSNAEIGAALEQAFADGSWGKYSGRHGERLAAALGEMHDVPLVSLCCSGTFAVELALRGLRIGKGDEVIMAGYDFPGNFRAIEAVGARPVLVDIDPTTWNLEPRVVGGAHGPHTRAIIVSHLHGGWVRMEELVREARKFNLFVVEDACQAPGATIDGRPAASWGDVGVLSFGGSKLLTAGRGGAVLTRMKEVEQRVRIHCERGNHAFPLSELQAAVLLPQVHALGECNARRLAAARRLCGSLADLPRLRPLVNLASSDQPAFYKLGFRFDATGLQAHTRAAFIAAITAEGVAMDAGFRGFSLRGARRCRVAGDLVECRRAASNCLLLHHPTLLESPEYIDRVASAIRKVIHAFANPESERNDADMPRHGD